MQDFMRKHRKLVLTFIIVAVGIPFVFFFGIPTAEKNNDAKVQEIANVGGVPITEAEFRHGLDAVVTTGRKEKMSYKELGDNGTADKVLSQLVDGALITLEHRARKLEVSESVLKEQTRQFEMFQDENKKFDPEKYNEWVESRTEWNSLYDQMRDDISKRVYAYAMLGPGRRILDKEVEEEVEGEYTKLTIKYAKIEPPVEPTQEEIQKQYADKQEDYRKPSTETAEFVALSLEAGVPQKALDAVKEAREGADFGELITKYADVTPEGGAVFDWREAYENAPPEIAPLFALKVGEVSEPVRNSSGFTIYKVDEERTNAEGAREVRGKQLAIGATLTEEQRTAVQAKAEQIAGKARKTDLATAAQEAQLTVQRTGKFTKESPQIENIPMEDAVQFRVSVPSQKDDKLFTPIRGRNNIYVAKVAESVPGDIPPLEEVLDKVKKDVVNATRQTDAYKAKVKNICAEIKSAAKSIDEIPVKFPDLKVEVKQTDKPFTKKDQLYQQEIYLQTTDVWDAVGKSDPGTVAGPLQGFMQDYWFVQLVERTPPTDEEKAKFPEEIKARRDKIGERNFYALLEDFTKDLRNRKLAKTEMTQDTDAIDRLLERGKYAKEDEKADKEASK